MFKFNSVNQEHFKRKKPLNRYEVDLVNKFYIHNGGVHQIVRFKPVGFSGVEIFFQKPSGKYSETTTTAYEFNKRHIFDTYNAAVIHLITVWKKDNQVPKYREEYFKELEKEFFVEMI